MAGVERVCISTNSVCNLDCKYCYFFLQPDALPGPGSLTADEIELILVRCHEYGAHPDADKPIKVNFVGSGEPLLCWSAIRDAIQRLNARHPEHRLRFYTVTNGLLLRPQVVDEMKALRLSPSVSLDGPAVLHDATRLKHNGRGSHADVMRGIGALRAAGVPLTINTTLTRQVVEGLDAYFDFIEEHGFDKIIFGRLVDVPDEFAVPTVTFYRALRRIAELKRERGLKHVEIGNLEAYDRALAGAPDRVCTMFGSTCGSGFHNIIYMQRDVYPCGRMVGQQEWVLGRFDEPVERFPQRMWEKVGDAGCGSGCANGAGPAGPDCLIDRRAPGYEPQHREQFMAWYGAR